MNLLYDEKIKSLPPNWVDDISWSAEDYDLQNGFTTIVLDDDPTGTQTVYDVSIFTYWSESLFLEQFSKKTALFYILTNSRSMNTKQVFLLYTEIGKKIKEASKITGRKYRIICRSDSTLRGHYPTEMTAIISALDLQNPSVILIPVFYQGGRYTIGDIHYVKNENSLVPVADTDYAKDNTFSFKSSDLKGYIEEKTNGRIKREHVKSISIDDIRIRGQLFITNKLIENNKGQTIIVNAQSENDLIVFTKALLQAEKKSFFLLRTAASIVPVLYGLPQKDLLNKHVLNPNSDLGGIIFVGSYVSTTTNQLNYLIENTNITHFEIDVNNLIEDPRALITASARLIDNTIRQGKDLVVYTSRKVRTGPDENASLHIINSVSAALVEIVKLLKMTPRFFVAKGGITSSDIATKAFGLQEAKVLGQIFPGVPVWQFVKSSKNRNQIYIVFPGNVGNAKSLYDVYIKLTTDF